MWECNGSVHQLFIDFKEAHESGGKHYAVFSLSLEHSGQPWVDEMRMGLREICWGGGGIVVDSVD
jgi:hypothetical protein